MVKGLDKSHNRFFHKKCDAETPKALNIRKTYFTKLAFSELQRSMFKLCGGGSQMLGILPRMKEKQTDLLCS